MPRRGTRSGVRNAQVMLGGAADGSADLAGEDPHRERAQVAGDRIDGRCT